MGYALIVRAESRVTPGPPTMVNATSISVSATICNRRPSDNASSVGGTAPSMELSMGTTAASAAPDRTASSAAGGLAADTLWTSPTRPTPSNAPSVSNCASAISVNVPDGPK